MSGQFGGPAGIQKQQRSSHNKLWTAHDGVINSSLNTNDLHPTVQIM
jgi:hypothetical protein